MASSADGILIENLTVSAGGRTLIEQANLHIQPGKLVLLVGPSGVGKSVLLRILAGLVNRQDGGIRYSGNVKIAGRSPAARNSSVGVVFQNFALFDELSPLNNIRFAAAQRRSTQRETPSPLELLKELGVPQSTPTSALSGGQRQRLAIARTLAYDPEVVLYDEPTSGLDSATGAAVARLIQQTHQKHGTTSVIVTHDYGALLPIADQVFVLDGASQTLAELPREQWGEIAERMHPATTESPSVDSAGRRGIKAIGQGIAAFLAGTTRIFEETIKAPASLLPLWKSPWWGLRSCLHYLRLVAGFSAWLYIAMAGLIIGYVTTYFTFQFLPYASYTKPLLIEDLLFSMGFALYRILVPVLASVLIAARSGAAVASDIGGKVYGKQMDALRTLGVSPRRHLFTAVLWAFLLGTPLLTLLCYLAASATSLVVFTATHADLGANFWNLHFHRRLVVPGELLYHGSGWLLAKMVCCAAGIALISYHVGARPKQSPNDVSRGITSTVLWATLFVLVVHFVFAFIEFEPLR